MNHSCDPHIRVSGWCMCALAVIGLMVGLMPPAYTASDGCSRKAVRQTAAQTKLAVVSDKHTERRPLEIHYDQPPAVLFVEGPSPVGSAEIFTPIRVVSTVPYPDLHVRAEWPTPSVTDLDLFLYDRWDQEVASSYTWNVEPLDQAEGRSGGAGYEYIDGVATQSCSRYTVRTGSWHSPGEKVTLKLWLGSSK